MVVPSAKALLTSHYLSTHKTSTIEKFASAPWPELAEIPTQSTTSGAASVTVNCKNYPYLSNEMEEVEALEHQGLWDIPLDDNSILADETEDGRGSGSQQSTNSPNGNSSDDDDDDDDDDYDDDYDEISFEIGSDYSFSDYSIAELEGDEMFQATIDAIREQVSRVDTLMAMDQLDTVKQELNAVRRKLSKKSAKLSEQRALCKLNYDRMATLELERDLYKADAHKLKKDLEACITEERVSTKQQQTNSTAVSSLSSSTSLGSHLLGQGAGEETSGNVFEANHTVGQQFFLTPQWMSDHHGAAQMSRIERSRAMAAKNGHGHRSFKSLSAQYLRSGSDSTFLTQTKEIASFIVSRKTKVANFARHDKVMSRLSLRRLVSSGSSKQQQSTSSRCSSFSPSSEIELTCISLEDQVEDLHHRLKTSTETAEELRRRLAMLNRHYETLVHRLQGRLVATTVDQANMQGDLVNQITAIDNSKQRAVGALEARLREKNEEIERLREV